MRLFAESVPEAIGLAYAWAKEWQGLLGGLLFVASAWILARAGVRVTRIRAAAMVRSAEIAARGPGAPKPVAAPAPVVAQAVAESPPVLSPQSELFKKLEQLRRLIRSALSTLGSDSGMLQSAPNFYCERISLMHFEPEIDCVDLPDAGRDAYKRLTLQLAVVRYAAEKGSAQAELSQALVQLNARARELSSVLSPPANPVDDSVPPERTKIQGRQ